jgi:F-type H+-transporting ATPase subunit delta
VVQRYAVTLIEAAAETGSIDAVHRDVERMRDALHGSPDLVACLRNRLVEPQRHGRILESLFGERVQRLTLNFLRLLAGRRRARLLPEILHACCELFEARAGLVSAQVRSAVALAPDQMEQLERRLCGFTGRRVRLQLEVDAGLRGGLVVQVGNTVFDGSLYTQLERLRRQLTGIA